MKHKPCVIWPLRASGSPNVTIRTHKDGGYVLAQYDGSDFVAFRVSRRDLRLLARRIEQALESTS